jgi:hypothetical protein
MTPLLLADWEAALPVPADDAPVFEDRREDDEETELARVDAKFRRIFGDETTWEPRTARVYVRSIEAIHDTFHPQEAAA